MASARSFILLDSCWSATSAMRSRSHSTTPLCAAGKRCSTCMHWAPVLQLVISAGETTERSLTGIMRNHTLMMVASTCRSVTVSHTVREHCRLSASLTGSQSAAFGAMRKMPSSRRPPLSRKLVAISSSTRGMSKPLMRMSSHDSRGMPKEGFHRVTLYGRPTIIVSESLRPSSGTLATRKLSGTLSALRGASESPCGSSPAQLSGRPTRPPVTGSALTLSPRCRLVGALEVELMHKLCRPTCRVVSCRTRPCPTVTAPSLSAPSLSPSALLSRCMLRRCCSCLTRPNGVHPSMPSPGLKTIASSFALPLRSFHLTGMAL
mmetsp:Transcript_8201/g.20431  ORF Transcript_8201/g.20431 Transcript_8201/m.20431 type:complete len:320 (-) Transcript_8201:161-1120(-)